MLRQSFDLVSEEMSCKTELAIFAGKNGNDVVWYDVTICVEKIGSIVNDLKTLQICYIFVINCYEFVMNLF